MSTAPVRGVLFDMDNTLIDWSGFQEDHRDLERIHLRRVYDHLVAVKRPLNANFELFVADYYERVNDEWAQARTTLRAPHLGKVLLKSLTHFGFREDDELDIDGCLQIYDWHGAEGVVVFPDVPAALAALQARGVPIGIVTNAYQPMSMRDAELRQYDLLQYFPDETVRLSAADVGYLKPHPKIFEYAAEKLGRDPTDIVFVGDSPSADIAGAQQVGMRAVMRVNGEITESLRALIRPDAFVNSLTELVDLIDEWNATAAG